MVDLRGRTVIPGLIDNHNHFVRATEHVEVRLEGVRSRADALAALRRGAAALAPDQWLLTLGGWHEEQWTTARGRPRSARSSRWSAAGSCTARWHRCYRASMGIRLSESAIALIDGRNYAVLATVNADGSPQTSVIWVGRDGDDLLFSTVEGRRKHRNMVRDPRVSVTVIDSADPETYVELRGVASMTPDIGRRFDTELSWKYDGKDPGEDRPGAVRVVVRVEVLKAAGYAA